MGVRRESCCEGVTWGEYGELYKGCSTGVRIESCPESVAQWGGYKAVLRV